MSRVLEGALRAEGLRFAIIGSRWNDLIVSRLIGGAEDALRRLGALPEEVTIVRVPGSYEIPLAAKRLAASGGYDAIICVGAIIRGETPHFEYVAGQCASGLARAADESGVPIAFGVLTTDTIEQAVERSGTKAGNKGADAAMVALEMANLLRRLAG